MSSFTGLGSGIRNDREAREWRARQLGAPDEGGRGAGRPETDPNAGLRGRGVDREERRSRIAEAIEERRQDIAEAMAERRRRREELLLLVGPERREAAQNLNVRVDNELAEDPRLRNRGPQRV